jgi:uncharacterized membrane protein YphA (DoxX/SURF4 family)
MRIDKTSVALWTVQGLLAALFLFAGAMKLVMPYDPSMSMGYPEWFLRFIGAAEALGGLGLVLPGVTRIATHLTSLAAAGLVIIMVGATVTVAAAGDVAPASIPLVVGVLCGLVAYKRSGARVRGAARPAALQPAG